MITITAPEKATQQHCELLRPRDLEGGIIQVRANRHGLYSRASNVGTCTSKTTHSDALLHTTCFLSVTYFMAWEEGVPKNREYIFDTKNRGKNNSSSCC